MNYIRILTVSLILFALRYAAYSQHYAERFNLSTMEAGKDYLSEVVIVKLKPDHRNYFDNLAGGNLKVGSITLSPKQMFPRKKALEAQTNAYGQPLVDLSLVYTMTLNSASNLEELLNNIYKIGVFEYAEPYFIPSLLHTPNDPFTGLQYHLQIIKAFEAWDIEKGDTNVVIGIVDTGTETGHADLMNTMKYNYDDPIDGIDNDNDGFLDNFNGWDIGEGDNDPDYVFDPHGIHVCGIASATTNNGTGVAGVGYNCKFLPVKATNQFGLLTKAYQGIVYAADKLCKVINCSWGQPGAGGQFGQDIVNYAVNNMGAVVVAAAGNSSAEHLYFPASYNNVISVGATDANDLKWPEATYNVHVDVTAPGHDIHSTWVNGTYLTSSGSSMAAPIVSGCIAIIASYYPQYSPFQLSQLLKLTTDNIDTLPANMPYAGKLGTGRVNLYKALTMINIPSVSMKSLNYSDVEFGMFVPGDTVLLSGKFINYLAPATNTTCTLTSLSPYITIIDSIIQFPPNFNTLDTVDTQATPFKIFVRNNMPVSTNVNFCLTYNDVNYTEKQYFSKTFNIDYITIDTNKITTTFTSKGRIGYNDALRYQGVGFMYENSPESQLKYGGFMLGLSPSKVSDNIYGSVSGSINNNFKRLVQAHKVIPSVFSDFDAMAVFNDSLAGVNAINVEVINNMYAWDTPVDEKYVITEYYVINKGSSQLVNLYTGLFMDWHIPDVTYHMSDFDQNLRLGYSYSTQGSYFTGIKLLTTANYRFYAFDNVNGIKVKDGFTNYEKYNAMRTNKFQAGSFSIDNDIMNLFSSGPFTINPGDTIKVAFALLVGDYLADLQQSASVAQIRYDGQTSVSDVAENKALAVVYPNPANQTFRVALRNTTNDMVQLTLTSNTGAVVLNESVRVPSGQLQTVSFNTSHLAPGLYVLSVTGEGFSERHKVIIY